MLYRCLPVNDDDGNGQIGLVKPNVVSTPLFLVDFSSETMHANAFSMSV